MGRCCKSVWGSVAGLRSARCVEVTGEMVLRFRSSVLDRHPPGGDHPRGRMIWDGMPTQRRSCATCSRCMVARANSVVPVPVTVPSIRVELGGDNPEAASWLCTTSSTSSTIECHDRGYADAKACAISISLRQQPNRTRSCLRGLTQTTGFTSRRPDTGSSGSWPTSGCSATNQVARPASLRCGAFMIGEVTDRDFAREVEQASMPVLVEFWQPGCGIVSPC